MTVAIRAAGVILAAAGLVAGAHAASPPSGKVLLGETRRGAILGLSPDWLHEYEHYAPSPADLESLRRAPKGALLKVYFGSWCGDSRTGVPHLMATLDAAQARRLKVKYYGVDRTKKEPVALLEGVGLERVPTMVLAVDGREIGRIVETPYSSIEHDLALLMERAVEAAGTP